jgi:hypothetical protein
MEAGFLFNESSDKALAGTDPMTRCEFFFTPVRSGKELRPRPLQLKVGTSAPETTTTVAPLMGLGKTSAPRVG